MSIHMVDSRQIVEAYAELRAESDPEQDHTRAGLYEWPPFDEAQEEADHA